MSNEHARPRSPSGTHCSRHDRWREIWTAELSKEP